LPPPGWKDLHALESVFTAALEDRLLRGRILALHRLPGRTRRQYLGERVHLPGREPIHPGWISGNRRRFRENAPWIHTRFAPAIDIRHRSRHYLCFLLRSFICLTKIQREKQISEST
jgi:hypothetical protein